MSSNNKTITIGLVLPYLKSRGTEVQALRLASGFVERGTRVVLLVVQGWGQREMYERFNAAGVEVHDVGTPVDVGERTVRLSRTVPLARAARRTGCHVLFSRAGMGNKVTGIAAKIAWLPSVVVVSGRATARTGSSGAARRLLSSWFRWYTYGLANRIVTVSHRGAEIIGGSFPLLAGRVIGIHNGIDSSEVRTLADEATVPLLDKNAFNICYAGSLELGRKGLDTLEGAMEKLVFEKEMRNIRLILIGSGPDEDQLRKMVHHGKIADHVLFVGEQTNPFPIMSQCDAFVLPSRREGLPNVLLEAMSLGLCCIASDCETGPNEIIEHNENGLLVPVGVPKILAEAIAQVATDDTLRTRMAGTGQQTVASNFSSENMVNSYHTLLMELACRS